MSINECNMFLGCSASSQYQFWHAMCKVVLTSPEAFDMGIPHFWFSREGYVKVLGVSCAEGAEAGIGTSRQSGPEPHL